MNNRSCLIWMALSGCALAASATNLGVLSTQPVLQTLSISAPDVSFAVPYAFSLDLPSQVSAIATPLDLRIGDTQVWGSTDFSLNLYDAVSKQLLATGSLVDGAYRIQDLQLSASSFFVTMAGITTGLSGDSFVFAIASQAPSLPGGAVPLPEPGALGLMVIGLAAIGLARRGHTASR